MSMQHLISYNYNRNIWLFKACVNYGCDHGQVFTEGYHNDAKRNAKKLNPSCVPWLDYLIGEGIWGED